MSKVKQQNTDFADTNHSIINFSEGIIGFPNLRQAALVPLPDYQPFCWLISMETQALRFLVVEPTHIFPDYHPHLPADIGTHLNLKSEFSPQILTIVKVSSDWKKTTVNLRAPLFFNPKSGQAVQIILSGTDFRHDAELPSQLLTEQD
jgi:flagellar assembly factor FliW